ncbi:CPBP family intramembrane glutamic endopeptidase [Parvularcula maris]|uniref:CPBP family intramembrane metalloprotease n=1 Tax=Parvularcula maris TaxID=2965077 RepID=A0A9X2L733_9PROT|nr:CPBP family intramembrane glutamic endopeptidase [Parvularcula maris]MCQ8184270.1 CPBP family intramembrane metalloprotease [Parvularcula maris]
MSAKQSLFRNARTGLVIGLLAAIGAVIGNALAEREAGLSLPSLSDLPLILILFASGFLLGFLLPFVLKDAKAAEAAKPRVMGPREFVLAGLLSSGSMAVFAFILGDAMDAGLLGQLTPSVEGLVLGVLLTVPLILLLVVIMAAPLPFLQRFRDQQIADFTQKGVDFGWLPIILISFGAGFGEELLFRGVLQTWLTGQIGTVFGIVGTSLIFGVVHGPRLGYMLISALIGVYLGTAYALSGSLLAVALAHFLYDIYALRVTVLAVRKAAAA